jgi:hypothetical protein
MSLTIPKLLKLSRETPVDFHFIRKLSGIGSRIRMVDYEGVGPRTTLKKLFGKADCVAILFHIVRDGVVTPVGHWCLLIKPIRKNPIQFFDSLGMGLIKILKVTGEKPYLLNLLRKRRWVNSSKKLQTQGTHFKECGCMVGLRAKLNHLSNSQFVRFIRSGGTKTDNVAVMLALLFYLEYYHKKILYGK